MELMQELQEYGKAPEEITAGLLPDMDGGTLQARSESKNKKAARIELTTNAPRVMLRYAPRVR
jgi:hypothetical protein